MVTSTRHLTAENVVECTKCGGKGSTKAYFINTDGKTISYEKICRNCGGVGYLCKESKDGAKHEDK